MEVAISLLSHFLDSIGCILEDKLDGKKNRCHNAGIVHDILIENRESRSELISSNKLESWLDDIDHGFFHGMMTACMSHLYTSSYKLPRESKIEDREYIELLLTCILHDFYKEYENHDSSLVRVYSKLCSITYSHSNPSESNSTHPLIVSDRIELMRFDDYKEFVDFSKFKPLLNREQDEIVESFYKYIRPKLKLLWIHRNKPWLRHHMEEESKWEFDKVSHYPQTSCGQSGKWGGVESGVYCVHTGSLSMLLDGCFRHVMGILPLSFLSSNANNKQPREHPSIEATNLNRVEDWVFIHNSQYDNSIKQSKLLKSSDIHSIEVNILKKFIRLSNLLYSYIYLHSQTRSL